MIGRWGQKHVGVCKIDSCNIKLVQFVALIRNNFIAMKGKGKGHPRTGHKGPEGK
jgi:hypothetical protein